LSKVVAPASREELQQVLLFRSSQGHSNMGEDAENQ